MKYLLISTSILLFVTTWCSAQNISELSRTSTRDSVKAGMLEQAALRNPVLRQINISTDIISRGNITSDLNGSPIFKGKAKTVRTSMIFNVPIKSWGKNSVSASVSYFQQHLNLTDVQSFSPGLSSSDIVFDKPTVGLTASFQRRDSLFHRPVYYVLNVSGLTNNTSSFKKVSYLGMAVFPLKQTANTSYSVGVIVNIDPSLKIPLFPLFSYWHKFQSGLEFNFNLPSQFGVRKELTGNLWGTFGTTLSGSVAFFNLDQPNLPRDVNYTTIDLKTGPGLEYRLGKKLIFGINGGILQPISARAFDRHKSSGDYFLNNKLSNVPYVNFSFSVLPFLK